MANRHQIYIWEATQADLSKGFYELSTKAISICFNIFNPLFRDVPYGLCLLFY